MSDYVMTIDSESEDDAVQSKVTAQTDGQLNPDFIFDGAGDPYLDFLEEDQSNSGLKSVQISVDDIIARRKSTQKRKRDQDNSEDEDSDEEGHSSDSDATTSSHQSSGGHNEPNDESESEPELEEEKLRREAFFDSNVDPSASKLHSSFLTMNLSRPLIKAITALNFSKPTPIQAATIPVALLGKDIVGNAVTGSGKTAAFIIPMLERLLYRDKGKKSAATRCLVLVPTRELAVQCFEVGVKLASQTDVRFCLIVGGLSVKSQEASLRERPDIVIATPGRLIDHIHNSMSFTLDALDILVLDEADRMLSEGFADELTEIVKACPVSRQTMLFSATMTDTIDELVKMSLNKPARLFVDPKQITARNLTQEFVRVRSEKEEDRTAILITLCKRSFKTKTIVFLRSKKLAHQLRIVFSLLGMKCGELHGDLSQEQRLQSLQRFRDGSIDYLMATDLASRGLDIKGIETVVNYDMPNDLAQYLHRVGRTARADAKGRSVTLVGEADRKILKAAMKHSATADQVRHRMVPSEAISKWAATLVDLKDEISEIMREEMEEKEMAKAERELRKGHNMMTHGDEIYSRPARTWFQNGKEKAQAEALSKEVYKSGFSQKTKDSEKGPKRDKFSGLSRKLKRRKLAQEDDEEDTKSHNAAIRSAKKAARPTKIGVETKTVPKRKDKRAAKSHGAFARDISVKGHVGEGARAKRQDTVKGVNRKVKPKKTTKR